MAAGGPNSAAGQPASIIPCSNAPELSNNIIQKRLAFDRDWSGTVITRAPKGAQRSCPAGSMADRGASVVRRDAAINRTEDLNVKGCEEIITCIESFCYCSKALSAGC